MFLLVHVLVNKQFSIYLDRGVGGVGTIRQQLGMLEGRLLVPVMDEDNALIVSQQSDVIPVHPETIETIQPLLLLLVPVMDENNALIVSQQSDVIPVDPETIETIHPLLLLLVPVMDENNALIVSQQSDVIPVHPETIETIQPLLLLLVPVRKQRSHCLPAEWCDSCSPWNNRNNTSIVITSTMLSLSPSRVMWFLLTLKQ